MHKLQYFSKYDLLDLYNSSGFNYFQGRFKQIASPRKAIFELHRSNHTFHKCVLNNGIQYHNDISFKALAHNSSTNYNMSK
jgi:hypothetical protein